MDPISMAVGLASFAPQIIKWITGSDRAAEAAGAVVGIAETVTGKQGADAVDALKADPALVLSFRQAIAAQEADLDKAFLTDVQNARQRDVDLHKNGSSNPRANWLVIAAIVLVAACLAIMVWRSNLDESAKGVITLILGRALGWVEQIFSFEFGSTRQSRVKDDTISKLSG